MRDVGELTLAGALGAGKRGEIDEWVDCFLRSVGDNPAMADGLKLQERYWLGPVEMDLERLIRCCGPEEEMEYQVDPVRFDQRVGKMVASIAGGWEPPPLIAHYDDGRFSVRDGNHRHEALIRGGHTRYWTIIWFDDENSPREGMTKLGRKDA